MKKLKQIAQDTLLPILVGSGMGIAIASIIVGDTTTGIIGAAIMVIGWVGLKVVLKHEK